MLLCYARGCSELLALWFTGMDFSENEPTSFASHAVTAELYQLCLAYAAAEGRVRVCTVQDLETACSRVILVEPTFPQRSANDILCRPEAINVDH